MDSTYPAGFANKPNANLQTPPQKIFNGLHMALIPTGPHRGKVIVFDLHYPAANQPPSATQRWSIVDPVNETMLNYDLPMPTSGPGATGDLFCTGHAWTKDGNLFVAGGTEQYPSNGGYIGVKLAYIWNPALAGNAGWNRQSDLQLNRWYPTVTVDDNDKLIVTGGLNNQTGGNNFNNDFEAFGLSSATSGSWDHNNQVYVWPGPNSASASPFTTYPRFHLLSTGEIFMSGHGPDSAKIRHLPTNSTTSPPWVYFYGNPGPNSVNRHDGTSFLFPIELDPWLTPAKDLVYRLGGEGGANPAPLATVESCLATSQLKWQDIPAMHHARLDPDAVLLPDGTVLVVGGTSVVATPPPSSTFVLTPELYKNGQWIEMADMVSPRDYHSTAVLLPSGKVLVGGGDNRTWDYEVYSPPYMFCGTRPQITTPLPGPTLLYGNQYTVHFAAMPTTPPTNLERVVLMRPGSVTHASCMDQRYVSLEVYRPLPEQATQAVFTVPSSPKLAPRGWYMLFLVDNHGVPSTATWVQLL